MRRRTVLCHDCLQLSNINAANNHSQRSLGRSDATDSNRPARVLVEQKYIYDVRTIIVQSEHNIFFLCVFELARLFFII